MFAKWELSRQRTTYAVFPDEAKWAALSRRPGVNAVKFPGAKIRRMMDGAFASPRTATPTNLVQIKNSRRANLDNG